MITQPEENVLLAASDLAALLQADERIIALQACEKALEDNIEAQALSAHFHQAEDKLNQLLNYYASDTAIAQSVQNELFMAKTALDTHPLVQAYLAAYRPVRELYQQINQQLFSPFNHLLGNHCELTHHRR